MKQIKRIAILGTENSHAQAFTNLIRTCPELTLIGAYGTEPAANERFSVNFGVPCVTDPAAFVGIADGVMITARNGATHLELARPYLTPGTAVFVDKPLCGTVADTEELLRLAERNGVLLSGGSCLQYAPSLLRLRNKVNASRADVIGASFSAPVEPESPYGGFLFYAPHLVQMCLTVLGNEIRTVRAIRQGNHITALLEYADCCASLFRMRHLLGNGLLPDEHLRRNGQKHSETLYKGIFRIPCATQRHLPYRADRTCRPRPHCLCH